MILKRIALHNFRNIETKAIDISPTLTVLVGENAKGKTNILESIHVAVHGEGFRETKEDELVRIGYTTAQIDTLLSDTNKDRQFRILFSTTPDGRTVKKFFVETVAKTVRTYQELATRTVLFSPEQITIINGSPDIRRSYINQVISQYDAVYKKSIINYEQALRKRNKILEQFSSLSRLQDELLFWDAYLEKEATYISAKRHEYVAFINNHPHVDTHTFSAEYIPNTFTLDRLLEKKSLELKLRKTLIGPQKDDFLFFMKGKHGPSKNVHKYGSRSEQRMTVFWLKVNEILFCEERRGLTPLLLLDDVFSEFDHDNKERILRLVNNYQTVLTTTEDDKIETLQKEHPQTIVVWL